MKRDYSGNYDVDFINQYVGPDISSFECETQVIGSLFIDDALILKAATELAPEDFTNTIYAHIFEVNLSLMSEGKETDSGMFAERFDRSIPHAMDFLRYACCSVVTTANFSDHLAVVRNLSKMRKAYSAMRQVQDDIILGRLRGENIDAVKSDVANVLTLLDDDYTGDAISIEQGFRQLLSDLTKPREYIKTGIDCIDREVMISKGDYVIIGGRPSSGKTAFTLQIAQHMAEKYRVVYFSLETRHDKIYTRMLARHAKAPLSALKKGGFSTEQTSRLVSYIRDAYDLKFFEIDAAGYDINAIRTAALSQKADVIFIDYVGLIRQEAKSQYERMTQISVELHTLAQKHNIAIFGLAQLNRAGDGDDPGMASLRDSGQLEQDADTIMFLSSSKDENKRVLTVRKNKDGRTGKADFEFIGAYQQFNCLSKEMYQ